MLIRAVSSGGRQYGMTEFAKEVAAAVGVTLPKGGGDFHEPSPVGDVSTSAAVRLVLGA